ncbi:golgin subfamily A member 7 isoform X1 [Rhinolophus sinicus]|uniref:golgin subfamily A member 7 isoform X1 n=1 Tax=Rhinolophus sinicus TaxID=89399 RepID=UPI003D7A383E
MRPQQAPVSGKVFIQRDYSSGTRCQFQTKFPAELENRIDRQQFEETVRTLNNLYAEAEKLGGQSYLEGCLACLTAYTIFLCMETHYEKSAAVFIQHSLLLHFSYHSCQVEPSLTSHLLPLSKVQAASQANVQLTFSALSPSPSSLYLSAKLCYSLVTKYTPQSFPPPRCHSSCVQFSSVPCVLLSSNFSLLF